MSKTPPPPPAPRNVPIGADVHLTSEPANDPRPSGAWVHVQVTLADGAILELTIPALGGAVAGYQPAVGEGPALFITRDGQRRRARLAPLLGGT